MGGGTLMGSWIQDSLEDLKTQLGDSPNDSTHKVCQEQSNILRGSLGYVREFLEQVQDVALNTAGKEQNLVALREDFKRGISGAFELITSYELDDWLITALLSEESREDFKEAYSGLYDVVELASGFLLEAASSERDRSKVCQAYSTFLMKKVPVSSLELAALNDRKQMIRMGISSEDSGEEDPVLQLLFVMLLEKKAPMLEHNQLQFKQHIGQGGYGTVYEAFWEDAQVDVAVKVMSSGDSSFRRELAALALCKHPNILRIFGYAFDSEKQQHSLVMEKMEMDLGDLILKKKGKFTTLDSVNILLKVAGGMAWLHSRAVVHRDLKPQNILVTYWNGILELRISDFGLSRTNFITSQVSFASTKLGTRTYMAPEVWSSEHYSKKSDVFSFAMICYELLTGRSPFQGGAGDMNDYMRRVCHGMRPLEEFPESCPGELAELTTQCWSGDAKDRPSFDEIHERLKVVKARMVSSVWDWNDVRKKLLASSPGKSSGSPNSGSTSSSTGRVNQIHSRTRLNTRRNRAGSSNSTGSASTTNNSSTSVSNHQQPSTYPPANAQPPLSNEDELMNFVLKGKIADAFQQAVTLKDPKILWWLASKVDSSLLNTIEEKLVYSIIDQLSEVVAMDARGIVDWMNTSIEILTSKRRYGSKALLSLVGKMAQGVHAAMAVTPRDDELAGFLRKSLKHINETRKDVEREIYLYGEE